MKNFSSASPQENNHSADASNVQRDSLDLQRSSTTGKWLVWLLRFLSIAAVISQLMLIGRTSDAMFSRPFTEDAFYALSVSRSIAEGHGITVDGVHLTNGIQPLICFVDSLAFIVAGQDMYLALQLVMLIHACIGLLAAAAIAKYMTSLVKAPNDTTLLFWLTMAAVQWNHGIRINVLNGLETGLSLAFVFGAAYMYNSRVSGATGLRIGWCIVLGLLLGFGILSRIDVALLAAAIVAVHVGSPLAKYIRDRRDLQALRHSIVQSFVIGVMALLVSLPWWLYNLTYFHSLMPISGRAQQLLLSDRVLDNVFTTLGLFSDSLLLLPVPPRELGFQPMSILGISVVAVVLIIARINKNAWLWLRIFCRSWASEFHLGRLVTVGLFVLTLCVYYTFAFAAPHFLFRYLLSMRVLIVLVALSLLYVTIKTIRKSNVLHVATYIVGAVWVSVTAILAWRDFAVTQPESYYAIAKWIQGNIAPEFSVGMFQSGTSGFLLPHQVVNLDGKVNAEALTALTNRTMPAYVDSLHLDYLIEWQRYLDEEVFLDADVKSRYRHVDSVNGFHVWKRTMP